jgi:hypothetical protein
MSAPAEAPPPRRAALLELATEAGAWHTVVSNSMYPLLPPGCQVRLERPQGVPRRGMVLAVWDGREVLVHRCVKVLRAPDANWLVVTRGDNCLQPDPPWRPEQVLGRVCEVRRTVPSHVPERALEVYSRARGAAHRMRAGVGRLLRRLGLRRAAPAGPARDAEKKSDER